MIPLLLITIVERFAFQHTHFKPNAEISSVAFALIVLAITCGVIITVCYLFEKPSEFTLEFAKSNEEEPPTYYEQWQDEPSFAVLYLIYGIICVVALFLLYNAASKGQDYMLYFRKYAFLLVIIDLVITGFIRYEIAPSIPHSIVGMIHFEASYTLRSIAFLVFLWGLMNYVMITLIISIATGGLFWVVVAFFRDN